MSVLLQLLCLCPSSGLQNPSPCHLTLSNALCSCYSGTFCTPPLPAMASLWCAGDLLMVSPQPAYFRGQHLWESHPSSYWAAQTLPVPSALSGTTKKSYHNRGRSVYFPIWSLEAICHFSRRTEGRHLETTVTSPEEGVSKTQSHKTDILIPRSHMRVL